MRLLDSLSTLWRRSVASISMLSAALRRDKIFCQRGLISTSQYRRRRSGGDGTKMPAACRLLRAALFVWI